MLEVVPTADNLWAGIKAQKPQPGTWAWDLSIPFATFDQTLRGIAVATKAADVDLEKLLAFVRQLSASRQADGDLAPVRMDQVSMYCQARQRDSSDHELQAVAAIAFVICAMREATHHNVPASQADFLWSETCLALEALSSSTRFRFTVNRSAQGFLAVPLCSRVKDGNIQELFRIHVWLPDGHRGQPELSVHSHQAFAHSWILAGKAKDHAFTGRRADYQEATHAEYSLVWTDGQNSSSAYKTHQTASTVANAGRYAHVEPGLTSVHTAGMYYTVPAASFHTTEVAPDVLHATLFFFDASRGFEKDAPVLGPRDGTSYTHIREDPKVTPVDLVRLVNFTRQWEAYRATGKPELVEI